MKDLMIAGEKVGKGAGVKERPLPMCAEEVRALLDGRKTQTRRLTGLEHINESPDTYTLVYSGMDEVKHKIGAQFDTSLCTFWQLCHYGQPGDRLWVQEKFQPIWASEEPGDYETGVGYKINYVATGGILEWYDESQDHRPLTTKCKPSIVMPRWASRLTLEIVRVRVERLQDITGEDAVSEGWPANQEFFPTVNRLSKAQDWYRKLWDSLNAKHGFGWDKNPWVWVIEFLPLKEAKR